MAAFTAKDVMNLRAKTGCGMMDCKKALTEADGDVDKAIDILREQGLAKAAKKADRIAAEGVAYAVTSDDNMHGVVIEVNAETDFVAKNAEFQAFVSQLAQTVMAQSPADVDALMVCKAEGSEMTVEELLREKIQTIFAVLRSMICLALHMFTQAERSAFSLASIQMLTQQMQISLHTART